MYRSFYLFHKLCEIQIEKQIGLGFKSGTENSSLFRRHIYFDIYLFYIAIYITWG